MKFPPTVTVQCPMCGADITVPAFLKGDAKRGPTLVTINFEASEAKQHLAAHVEAITTGPTGSAA